MTLTIAQLGRSESIRRSDHQKCHILPVKVFDLSARNGLIFGLKVPDSASYPKSPRSKKHKSVLLDAGGWNRVLPPPALACTHLRPLPGQDWQDRDRLSRFSGQNLPKKCQE